MQRLSLLWDLLQFNCKECCKYDITVTPNSIFKYQVLWFSVTFMLRFVPKIHISKMSMSDGQQTVLSKTSFFTTFIR